MYVIDLKTAPVDLALSIFGSVGVAGSVSNAVVAHIGEALHIEPSIASQVAVEVAAVD